MASASVQDKYRILEDPTFTRYLMSRYEAMLNQPWWWLEPMPVLKMENLRDRIEYSERVSGIHGEGDPVWGASVIHMAEQASGTPFSIQGPDSAVKKSMDLMFSAPGGYREMIKQLCYSWVVADIGAPVEIVYEAPRKIRDGVYYKPKPAKLDVFDPARIRLVAPQTMAYPYAYQTNQTQIRTLPPAGWGDIFGSDEIPLSKESVGRIVNLPLPKEEMLGCGVSPTTIALKEWQIAMGNLELLLQDATNTSAYTILLAKGLNNQQVMDAMKDRETRIRDGQTHALASALMIFADGDYLDEGSQPAIQGLPLRRYAENWNWRMWLEERIQVYATILGISPMSIIMSIYARANQAGAQYAADEAGVRRTSLMTGLSDIFSNLMAMFGATFQYRSHRLADRDREFTVFQTAVNAWKMMYEATNNGIPLLADTAEEAARRARTMMAEQRIIKEEYADDEDAVSWDTEIDGSLQGGSAEKTLAFLGAAMRGEDWVEYQVDPAYDTTKVVRTVIGKCKLREKGRPATWHGWSSKDLARHALPTRSAALLKEAVDKRKGGMIALYPSPEDAQALALGFEGGIPADQLHVTLAYIEDRTKLPVTPAQVAHLVDVLAGKTPAQMATISGIGRFGEINAKGTQPLYASVDSEAIHDLREHVEDALEAVGIVSSRKHGFQPHITLAYLPANAQMPNLQLEPREIALTRIGLAWGDDVQMWTLLQPTMAEKEAVSRSAPRKQRKVQEAWDADMEAALGKLRRAMENYREEPVLVGQEPPPEPTISDRDLAKLQSYVDQWEASLEAIEATQPPDNMRGKIMLARENIEQIQSEIDRKENQRRLLALLAIFLFGDDMQRRGGERITEGMALAGLDASNYWVRNELRQLGTYVQGSLTTDLVNDYMAGAATSSRLGRRVMVFYGGALWKAMQLAVQNAAPAGTRMMVSGPNDENTCQESDPGGGIACASIVGRTYVVGQDDMPVLGQDTKCGQACRHWWEIVEG